MDLFCSFCRKSSFQSRVVSLEGLEFKDRNGWSTSVTKILEEILPEVMDATAICEECVQTINNFYQLKRDLNLGIYKYGDLVEQKFIKDEFGEFSVVSDSNRESIESSVFQSKTKRNSVKPIAQLTSAIESGNGTVNVDRRLTSLKKEKEDELLVETQESSHTKRTAYFEPVKSRKDPLPLLSFELEEFKALSKKNTGDGFRCSICSQRQLTSTTCFRHMVHEHSRNKELLEKWIEQQIVATSDGTDWSCSLCQKCFNSQQALRYHLFSHIIEGEVGDAEFLAMRCQSEINKRHKPTTSAERHRKWRLKHPEHYKVVNKKKNKEYRIKQKKLLTQERQAEIRLKNNERQRRFRARKKEQQLKNYFYD